MKLNSWFREPLVRALAALLLVLLIGTVFHADGAFFQWGTHRDMLRSVSVCGILACGMTLVIVAGGIDLAVGSLVGLTAVSFSLLAIHQGLNPVVAIGLTLAAGLLCGLVSGGLTARFQVQAFIATLAMMVVARGLAKWLSGGQKISTVMQKADGSFENAPLPAIFDHLNARVLAGNLTVVSLIFLGCVALCWVILARLRWGRYLYAIGGNEEAARLSGVPVRRMKLLAYGLCGLFSAVAGICQAVQELQGDPEAGQGYELTAIAMVVIGGTSLAGGRGGVGLTLVGALTIGYLDKILSINAVGEAMRLMLTGAIIIGAVLLQRRRT